MRVQLSIVLLCSLAFAGCAGKPTPAAAPRTRGGPAWGATTPTNQALTVTPETVVVGKVALVNAVARHVVLTFPLGRMPAVDQRLNLYRRGLKVGEVKATGWQREDNVVADWVAGEAEVGDEARTQ